MDSASAPLQVNWLPMLPPPLNRSLIRHRFGFQDSAMALAYIPLWASENEF
jgi:hypothetical protein